MIICQIIGGLGNQMFQYAVGRALSLKLGHPLLLDVSAFESYGLHQGFELQRVFNSSAETSKDSEVQDVLGWQSSSMIRRAVSRQCMTTFRCKSFVVEPQFHYWSGINDLSEDCYLQGYWQSEKYFLDAALQIRGDFAFRLPINPKNSELATEISQVNAVSLHVRRGDYVNNPKTTATHGLCSLDYYQKAIEYIAERMQQPHFYIFSDDIAWVKNNLNIGFPHKYVDCNHFSESYNDMRLMSLCKHNIIANSSFSWWGAWLNKNPNKIVIAPQRWFKDSAINTKDLIPESWVRL